MRHDILEVASVPRKQAELKALMGVARQARRKSNLMRFVAYNLAAWAVIVVMLHGCSTTRARVVSSAAHEMFLPIVIVMHGK